MAIYISSSTVVKKELGLRLWARSRSLVIHDFSRIKATEVVQLLSSNHLRVLEVHSLGRRKKIKPRKVIEAIRSNRSLRSLYLCLFNNLCGEQVHLLLYRAPSAKVLTHLTLITSSFGGLRLTALLAKAVKHNNVLQKLEIEFKNERRSYAPLWFHLNRLRQLKIEPSTLEDGYCLAKEIASTNEGTNQASLNKISASLQRWAAEWMRTPWMHLLAKMEKRADDAVLMSHCCSKLFNIFSRKEIAFFKQLLANRLGHPFSNGLPHLPKEGRDL